MRDVQFVVYGVAQPKGSTRAFVPKGWRRPVVTSDNPRVKDWQQCIAAAAQAYTREFIAEGAIVLTVEFALPRPKSLPKRVVQHVKKPDLDKLVRAVKDALTGVLWQDDSQVTSLTASKRYAAGAPCAAIRLHAYMEEDLLSAAGASR